MSFVIIFSCQLNHNNTPLTGAIIIIIKIELPVGGTARKHLLFARVKLFEAELNFTIYKLMIYEVGTVHTTTNGMNRRANWWCIGVL